MMWSSDAKDHLFRYPCSMAISASMKASPGIDRFYRKGAARVCDQVWNDHVWNSDGWIMDDPIDPRARNGFARVEGSRRYDHDAL